MLHIIRGIRLTADVILYAAEKVRDLFYGALYSQSSNTVDHDRIIKICPESDLFSPSYQPGEVELLEAVREKAVLTVFVRLLQRLIIDPPVRCVIEAVP